MPDKLRHVRTQMSDIEAAGELRIIACVCCGGDRGHFDDGNQHWITCRACNGEGEIEIEPEPIELDDL